MASQSRRLEVIIAGDASSLKRALDQTERDTSGLGGKLKSSLGGAGALITGAAVAGLGGLALAAKGAYDAAVESKKIADETTRVIQTTGGAAQISAKQVSDLATALSFKTGVDDEAIQSSENLLLTFTSVQNKLGAGNDIFTQATGLALDMSKALGTDLNDATLQLGKALNDPISGMTALRRSGVSFTEQQQDQIKWLAKSGDLLGAQKIILGEVGKEFGGAAQTAAQPLDILKVKLGNIQEQLGAKLIPIVDKAATWIGDNLPKAIDFLSQHADQVKQFAIVFGVFAAAAFLVANPIILIVGALAALAAGVVYAYNNWQWFHTAVDATVQWLQANVPPAWEMVRSAIAAVADFLVNTVWPKIQSFYDFISAGVMALVGFVQDHWNQISSIISSVWDMIKNIVQNAWIFVSNTFQFFQNILTGHWSDAWNNIRNILSAVWDTIKNVVSNGWDTIKNLFLIFGGWLKDNAWHIWDGLMTAFKAVVNFIIRAWNGIQFDIPGFDLGPIHFGGFTLGVPDIPELHSGGTFNPPAGQGEGLALLRRGEQVLTPTQQMAGVAGGGRPLEVVVKVGSAELARELIKDIRVLERSVA